MRKEHKAGADPEGLDVVYDYHQRTKHRFEAYAAGPQFLDWADQPDPFRRFAGSSPTELPLSADRQTVLYADLYRPGAIAPQPFSLATIAVLLELAFGLSAWKQYGGERWALRCNPSSGNLHPTEAYLATGKVCGLASGVYHYSSHDHVLESRCRCELPLDGLVVGLSSIHWREAWKYGERAFRYCQHDAGHALAALRYAAGVLGWSVRLLADWSDDECAFFFGLDRAEDFAGAEQEHPDLICLIQPAEGSLPDARTLLDTVRAGRWAGQANRLSPVHRFHWPIIEKVSAACAKPGTVESSWAPSDQPDSLMPLACPIRAADLIRQRRSAQHFDGHTGISQSAFYRLLDSTLPRAHVPPFDLWPWPPHVHLILFVHRVEDLAPGLYCLARSKEAAASLRSAMRDEFDWQSVKGCPEHLPLFHLISANAQNAARTLSCHQRIAGDSAFSLGMLAEFETALAEGPWVYRRLFWETGLIGQALYLEAEAAGLRGTGIGCYFDDPVHELLGIEGKRLQSLYHFTVGGPLDDTRLQSLPPYEHLKRLGA